MCGIFAYTGNQDCRDKLVHGLRMLEYRGYDSAGIIAFNSDGSTFCEKAVGRVSALATKVSQKQDKHTFTTGIAHTRWATHGEVTEANTHPHSCSKERFYIVHNGIIENYKELREKLTAKGYSFYSQTDTEVVVKLLEDIYDGDLVSSIQKVTQELVGAYSIAVVDTQEEGKIVGMKLGSPLIVGTGIDGIYISSDINALASYADTYTVLEDHEMVVINEEKYSVFMSGKEVEKTTETITEQQKIEDLGIFESFTEKEIHDIPVVIENVCSGRINFTEKLIQNETLERLAEEDIERIVIIASGSSFYAGEIGGYMVRRFAGLHVETIISSEFLSDIFVPDNKALYVFLSQSGETADVRESLKIVKGKGLMTFGIVNVVGSTIARNADMGLYSHAGAEIGVASTKNVIAQILVLLMMALSLGNKRNLQGSELRDMIGDIHNLPNMVSEVFEKKQEIQKLAKKYSQYKSMFVLGRNYFYPVAGEAALKCKELSYIHCESYSAGELKHGPLALISPDFPTIVFNPMGRFYAKTVSNLQEVAARKGPILGFISARDTHKELYTDTIELPDTSEMMNIFTGLVASYLFAMYTAIELDRDVDKPRNLAKSVTVE